MIFGRISSKQIFDDWQSLTIILCPFWKSLQSYIVRSRAEIAMIFSLSVQQHCNHIRCSSWPRFQSNLVPKITSIAIIFGPYHKNNCNHKWSNPIELIELMESKQRIQYQNFRWAHWTQWNFKNAIVFIVQNVQKVFYFKKKIVQDENALNCSECQTAVRNFFVVLLVR